MKKRASLRITPSVTPVAPERVPRMVARGIYRKLRAQGFTDAEINAVAKEIVGHCHPRLEAVSSTS